MEIVHIAELPTRVGMLRLAATEKGLAYVGLPHAGGRGFSGFLRRFAPDARTVDDSEPSREAARQILEYLEGARAAFELPLDLRGTSFQRAVYEALLAIPYGETRSYGEVARALGRPGAQRAVGAANATNPIPLVVPCHRVIAARGRLGGYGGGRRLKARLLAMEHSHQPAGALL